MDAENALSVHNLAFLEALYEAYQSDPSSVDPEWIPFLQDYQDSQGSQEGSPPTHKAGDEQEIEQLALQTQVDQLIEAYRLHGHLKAGTDPLGRFHGIKTEMLEPEHYGLSEKHMDRFFHSSGLTPGKITLGEIIARLEKTYCSHIGVEYWHLSDSKERAWLQHRMESCQNSKIPSHEGQLHLLDTLAKVENVDNFLHSKFLGAKRFSISGAESAITLLECLIEHAGSEYKLGEVIIGMAHRGRLNVLMNIMGKSPAEVFSEFQTTDSESFLGAGDVKYHLGYHRHHVTRAGEELYLALAFNPSHLEAITPVIQGRIRARQDQRPDQGTDASLGVTIHGDAAFIGQGVVAETLNLSGLDGYEIGGAVRVVINNQIGFTSNPPESRSGLYCTDPAHVLQVPIFHINGDDPEAANYTAQLALDYRQRFQRDVIIDLICYRRYGHNEGDDPTFTQPMMYEIIKKHPSVRSLYQNQLIQRGTISEEQCKTMDELHNKEFLEALEHSRNAPPAQAFSPMHGVWEDYFGGLDRDVPEVSTALSLEDLHALTPCMTDYPEDFNVHRKIKRFLSETQKMLANETPMNWATAELLAYASLLKNGAPIRFSGQDAQRGTFSHRHAVFTDQKTGECYTPLAHIDPEQASFDIYNSPLSEYSVMGFEMGYSLATPQALVVWEAQFGDFANGAQVMIDQFLCSSEDKWNRLSGLVLLLPHGYEGQGLNTPVLVLNGSCNFVPKTICRCAT